MTMIHFPGAASAPDLAAKRAAFQALSPEEQAQVIARFEVVRAAAAAIKAQRAQVLAARAIHQAQRSSTTP